MSVIEADVTEKEVYVFPTSLAQQRLWFLNQLEPDSAAYNIVFAVRISGDLHVRALEQSLQTLVSRHEILRTTFSAVEGRPVQVVAPRVELTLPVIDLRGWPEGEREDRARALARDDSQRLFDLVQGPLLRTTLVRLTESEHVLLLSMHHIVSDGWSMNVFVSETAALYESFRRDEPSPLSELPLQYADYAIWQREWLESAAAESQLSYWRQQFSTAPAVLDLPFDRPRTTLQSAEGRKHSIFIAPELTGGLKTLSRQEGTTLFMTLLAAFQALLYRYTNQEDVTVGSTVAGRDRREIEGLIGCFLNTLVLRTDLSGEPTFRELLGRVREVALAAYANQDVPVEMLLEELQPERHLSHNPLFQVMFILQNTPLAELQLADVRLNLLPNEYSTPKFDLTLDLTESSEGLAGFIEYRSELFTPETIGRFSAHFQTMLAAIVESPDMRVMRLPLLTTVEEEQLLVEFSQSDHAGSSGLCLHQLFEQQAKRTPSAMAVVGAGEELTYAELATRSQTLAKFLQAKGLQNEQLIGICLERTPQVLVAMLGILAAGGTYVPLDPRYPSERISWILKDARASWLLTEESLLDAMQAIESECKVLSLDSAWNEIAREAATFNGPEAQVDPANIAYVIYTSGSTGTPKGVAVQHQSIVSYVETATELFEITSRDRVLQFASISFDTSAEEIYPALASGATLVLRNDDMLSSAAAFMRQCEEWSITVLDLPTGYWHGLAGAADLKIPESLRLVILGGEKALRERVSQWQRKAGARVRLVNTYGPTEATIVATSYEVNDLPATALEVPIGRAVRNAETYVLDARLQPVPIGVAGELHIAGRGLARGYLNGPELTAQKFIPHPFSSEAGARFYKTGDRARYISGGQLEFLGRVDHQIKLRGFRIEPGEIEAALCEHVAVDDAVVLLREAADEKRLVTYVQTRGATVSQLRTLLQQKLPDYMIPSSFVLLDELPRTPSGKVDRAALPEPEEFQSDSFVAPRNPSEELVAEIWRQVLNVPQVGAADNFFHLGGHSLLATQVTARLRDELRIEIPLRAFFETPTVAGIAAQIDARRRGGQAIEFPPIERVRRDQSLPLSFSQERLWFISQLDPDNTAYHVPRAIRINGDLNVDLVRATFTEIIRRHEILRTSFPTVDGGPVQVIHPPHLIDLPLSDLRLLPQAVREAEVQRFIQREGNLPFDFTQEPLIRVSLLQIDDLEHVLVLAEHHLVHDGWTQGVLMRDFVAIYSAFRLDQPSPLTDLEIQYADFAHWQRRWLQGSVLEEQLDYWKKQLAGAPAFLELPGVNPRPPVQSFHGAEFNLELDAATSDALRDFSSSHGVTLFMTMLAAFDLLLMRYSGATDVVVGSGIANRRWQAFENLLGMIINTVVLRVDLSGNPTFIELLQRVRDVTLDAYSHQDLPFEKLVEELQPERTLSYTPIFQVMFSFLDTPMAAIQLPGLEIEAIGAHNQTAKFDLNVVVITPSEQTAGLRGIDRQRSEITVAFEYSTDIFDEPAIEQLATHYRRLLHAVVANPERRLLELPLLSTDERELTLNGLNQTPREYPRNETVGRLFEQQVERAPEAVVVVFGDTELTYGELNKRANRLAQHLRSRGVGPDVTVGLFVERSIEMIVALLGILKAGGAYVPLDPQNPAERSLFILKDANVSLLLTQKQLRDRLPESNLPVVDLDSDEVDFVESNPPEVATKPDNLAYVMYTSGSTGLPKGVAVTHRNILRLVMNADYVELGSDEVFLQLASLSFDASTFEIWGSLLHGARLVIMPPQLPMLEDIARTVRDHQVTTLWLTSGLFTQMVDEHVSELAGVRQLLAGGDVLSAAQVRKVLAEKSGGGVINGYGPTESTTFACCYRVTTDSQIANSIPIGKPIPNTVVYILDGDMQPVPNGVTGELYIGGDGLARGYFQRPQLTAERFVPDPFSGEPGARLYRTGDLTRYLRDGNIDFVGRADQQVKLRGFRVELDEVEAVLDEHPRIGKAVVVTREDDRGGKRLVAYIVQSDQQLTTSDLREYLQERLPDYMIPSSFVTLDELPLTRNGKIDRAALRSRDDVAFVGGSEYVAPRTPVEETLASIWSEVLGVPKIGVHDNFFELGGHSLLATRLLSRARQAFQTNLPLHKLFETPTIAAFAAVVESLQGNGSATSVPVIKRLSRAPQRSTKSANS
jgi:amino acid adenylation domain-containing protein